MFTTIKTFVQAHQATIVKNGLIVLGALGGIALTGVMMKISERPVEMIEESSIVESVTTGVPFSGESETK